MSFVTVETGYGQDIVFDTAIPWQNDALYSLYGTYKFYVTAKVPSPESQDAKKTPPNNGYASKVKISDRYKVVGFISSGTYGRVYKAIGHNGQSGEFAIKKYFRHVDRIFRKLLIK